MAKSVQYPRKIRLALTAGQYAALQEILPDPEKCPPHVDSITALIRYYVQEGIMATGMPLGPVEIEGHVTIGPVPPERDTIQKERRKYGMGPFDREPGRAS